MKFRIIEDQRETFPVRVLCDVMGVSTAGYYAWYYAWRGRPESPRKAANRALLTEIRRLHLAHRGRYGGPRIHAALRGLGHTASRGRVERLMRHHGIQAITPRRFRACTTGSRHDWPIAPNRLAQKFVTGGLIKSGSLTSPMSQPRKDGSIWLLCSIFSQGRSSAGRCVTTCGRI